MYSLPSLIDSSFTRLFVHSLQVFLIGFGIFFSHSHYSHSLSGGRAAVGKVPRVDVAVGVAVGRVPVGGVASVAPMVRRRGRVIGAAALGGRALR